MIKLHECLTACYEIPGQTWPSELSWLYNTFRKSRAHAEVGTYCGRSLMAACGGMADGASVVVVDNDCMPNLDKTWIRTVRAATYRMIHQSVRELPTDSLSAALLCHAEGLRFDSVFVDGCHEYAECRADIEAWMPLLKPGGIIAGHDYWPKHVGVMDAVNYALKDRFSVVPGTRIWFASLVA